MRKLIILLFVISAIGCDPVRRVLDDVSYRTQVADALLREGICKYDTVTIVKNDTTVLIDTLGIILTFTDTVMQSDTVRISTIKYRDIVKRITIRDTVTISIVDASGMNAANKHIAELEGMLKSVGGEAERYRWATALLLMLLVALIVMAIRK